MTPCVSCAASSLLVLAQQLDALRQQLDALLLVQEVRLVAGVEVLGQRHPAARCYA